MPYQMPHNCAYGTCGVAVPAGVRFCATHEKPTAQDKQEATTHERNRNRNEPWRKWYHTAHWRALRHIVFERDGFMCVRCNRYAATVADHIKPHKGVWAMFIDMGNLQSLCKICHDQKTATEDGGFGNALPNAVVPTGEPGKQFTSSSVGEAALDRALAEEI